MSAILNDLKNAGAALITTAEYLEHYLTTLEAQLADTNERIDKLRNRDKQVASILKSVAELLEGN